jgi:hypothetical protein
LPADESRVDSVLADSVRRAALPEVLSSSPEAFLIFETRVKGVKLRVSRRVLATTSAAVVARSARKKTGRPEGFSPHYSAENESILKYESPDRRPVYDF